MEEDYTKEKHWYILQTSIGFENVAKTNLLRRIETMNMQDKIFQVLIPEEVYYDVNKSGKKVEKRRKTYPGYVFIEMKVDSESWFIVRNTPGVTGFLGSSGKGAQPVPIGPEEINPILQRCGMLTVEEFALDVGDEVRVISGPFKDTIAKIEDINEQKRTVKIFVEMFGRKTEYDVSFDEVEAK